MGPTLKLSALITWPSLDQVTTEPSEIENVFKEKENVFEENESVTDLV